MQSSRYYIWGQQEIGANLTVEYVLAEGENMELFPLAEFGHKRMVDGWERFHRSVVFGDPVQIAFVAQLTRDNSEDIVSIDDYYFDSTTLCMLPMACDFEGKPKVRLFCCIIRTQSCLHVCS